MCWIKCLYTNPKILKYSTDELLKIMYAFMNANKEKKSDTKMIIYSGHDTTIFHIIFFTLQFFVFFNFYFYHF